MTEHTVAIVSFEGALKREIKRVREQLQKVESISAMHLEIQVAGNIHEGDLKLTYRLGQYAGVVEGDSLLPVVEEFMRRHGWEKVHTPLAIGYERIPSDSTVEEDEIPY